MLTYGYTSTGSPHAGSYAGRGGDGSPLHQALLLKKERFFKALPFIGSCFVNITSNTVIVSQTIKKIGRAGQTRTFSRFCVFAHPTRKHFDDAMGEDATVL